MIEVTYKARIAVEVTYDNNFKAEYLIEYSNLDDYISGDMLMYGFTTAVVTDAYTGERLLQVENSEGELADELLS